MPTVAAMIADPADRRLTAEQVGQLAVVRFCETVEGLVELVAGGGVDAVVADLHDASGTSILPTFPSSSSALRRPRHCASCRCPVRWRGG